MLGAWTNKDENGVEQRGWSELPMGGLADLPSSIVVHMDGGGRWRLGSAFETLLKTPPDGYATEREAQKAVEAYLLPLLTQSLWKLYDLGGILDDGAYTQFKGVRSGRSPAGKPNHFELDLRTIQNARVTPLDTHYAQQAARSIVQRRAANFKGYRVVGSLPSGEYQPWTLAVGAVWPAKVYVKHHTNNIWYAVVTSQLTVTEQDCVDLQFCEMVTPVGPGGWLKTCEPCDGVIDGHPTMAIVPEPLTPTFRHHTKPRVQQIGRTMRRVRLREEAPEEPYFDRFDICEAYYQLEVDYNQGGWLRERPSNQRRNEATHVQLYRMQFKLGAGFKGFASLSDNAQAIYRMLEERYGFIRKGDLHTKGKD